MKIHSLSLAALILFFLSACEENNFTPNEKNNNHTIALPEDFKNYWFDGQAEITSYNLEQERYGEIREGTAVLIFVTEDFLPEVQVKADKFSEENLNVLKLNKTKKFNTGIYPYSIMSSVFYPLKDTVHALKVSTSVQEWCGHAYIQLNNRNDFEINSHSYFEGEADKSFTLNKTHLEDELWPKIRINPEKMPQGEIEMIPSLEYSRLQHKEVKSYEAEATLEITDSLYVYSVYYPELDRKLTLFVESSFPYQIMKWKEERGQYATTATKRSKIQSDYWSKNKNEDSHLRDSLQLN